MILPVIFHGKDGPAAAEMLDRWTPAFTHAVPAVVHETAQDLAEELVDVALHRLPEASRIGPLKEHFGTAVHYPDGARVRKHREIEDDLLDGMILTLHEELQAVWVQCLVRALTANGSKPLTKTTWNLLLDSVGPVVVEALSDTLMYMTEEAPPREAEVEVRIDPKSRILPTGPTTTVTWIGDVRGRRTVALDPWWERGDSLLLDEASRGALIGAAKVAVAALARLTTRDHALLRVGLPEVTRRGPTNVLPLARDSAVIECPLRVFEVEAPREVVLYPVPDHHTARELKYALAGPVDTVHALWAPALAAAAQAHDAAHSEPPWMESVVNASLRDYAEAEG